MTRELPGALFTPKSKKLYSEKKSLLYLEQLNFLAQAQKTLIFLLKKDYYISGGNFQSLNKNFYLQI